MVSTAAVEDMAAEEPRIYDACSDECSVAIEREIRTRVVTRKNPVHIEKLGGATNRIDARIEDERPLDGSQSPGRICIVGIQQADNIAGCALDPHIDGVVEPTTAILKDDDIRMPAEHLKRAVDRAAIHDDMLDVALLL